jgi:hypothetical protein
VTFTLDYHRAEDRMTVCFALPSGETRTCWVTRQKWLSLILRLSEPAQLPTQIDGPVEEKVGSGRSHGATVPSAAAHSEQASLQSQTSVESERVWPRSDAETDQPMIVKSIGVVKTQQGLRVSLRIMELKDDQSATGTAEKINLNISSDEREVLLATLSSKARQAGWDLDAGIKRMRAYQRTQKQKPIIH